LRWIDLLNLLGLSLIAVDLYGLSNPIERRLRMFRVWLHNFVPFESRNEIFGLWVVIAIFAGPFFINFVYAPYDRDWLSWAIVAMAAIFMLFFIPISIARFGAWAFGFFARHPSGMLGGIGALISVSAIALNYV